MSAEDFKKSRGWELFRRQSFAEAITEFRHSLNLNPQDTLSHYYLGLSLLLNADVNGATAQLEKLLLSTGNESAVHFALGYCYSRKREWERSIKESEWALELSRSQDLDPLTMGNYIIQAAAGIDLAQGQNHMESLHVQLRQVSMHTVRALMNAMVLRDEYLRYHSRRVSTMSKELARTMVMKHPELSEEIDPETVAIGAALHDVGKIGIPDFLINKPGELTEHEFFVMKKHPEKGYRMLKDIHLPWRILPLVRHHHERFDGTGYPDGLSGEGISLGAMIISICNVFDSLVTDKPYRKGLSCEEAMGVIRKKRDADFASTIVDYFLEIVPRLDTILLTTDEDSP